MPYMDEKNTGCTDTDNVSSCEACVKASVLEILSKCVHLTSEIQKIFVDALNQDKAGIAKGFKGCILY
jgi:hypothetical protein